MSRPDALAPPPWFDAVPPAAAETDYDARPAAAPHRVPSAAVAIEQILAPLTSEQRAAATAIDADVVVVAGPGTGKTATVAARLAYILAAGAAAPDEILAITFTNKAAGEMRERVARLTGLDPALMAIATFHATCRKILREHHEEAGLAQDFSIADEEESARICRDALLERSWPVAGRKKEPENAKDVPPIKPAAVADIISAYKDRAITPGRLDTRDPFTPESEEEQAARDIYPLYNAKLRERHAVDFGDLILECLLLFQRCPRILRGCQERWRHILVDEAQDANTAQNLWLDLAARRSRLACVGDDDQAIYGWRNADTQYFLDFRKRRPRARVIRLSRNFRSTRRLLGAASGLIRKNANRYDKNLWTTAEQGTEILAARRRTAREEAERIVDAVRQYHRGGTAWRNIAILVRAHWIAVDIEQEFLRAGLPYLLQSKTRFLDRKEIRDILAYLRLVRNLYDDGAFERAVERPKRGAGPQTLERLKEIASREHVPLIAAALNARPKDGLGGAVTTKLSELADTIDAIRQELRDTPLPDTVMTAASRSGYLAMLAENEGENDAKEANIRLLSNLAQGFPNLGDFLDHLQLDADIGYGSDKDAVRISTIHAAKGLEYDAVFLPGWEKGVIPARSAEFDPALLEEERRLAYVALTRAKKHIYLSWTAYRHDRENRQSPFLDDIPGLRWRAW